MYTLMALCHRCDGQLEDDLGRVVREHTSGHAEQLIGGLFPDFEFLRIIQTGFKRLNKKNRKRHLPTLQKIENDIFLSFKTERLA
jgi:hypothetical protein